MPTGIPGPRSTTRRSTRSPKAPASMRTGWSAGDQRTAFSTTLATARSRSAGSASTGGSPSARWTTMFGGSRRPCPGDTPHPPGAEARGPAMALSTTSSTDTGWSAERRAPTWSRLMSSRFATSAMSRSVSSAMVETNSSRSSGDHGTSLSCRLEAAALIDASGVRRSCDTAWSRALRSSLASASTWARPASARSRPRSMTAASCAEKALRT